LQSWIDKKVGHVNSQLALACEVLHQLKIVNGRRILSSREIWLKNNLKKHSLALASFQRTIARSRSCIGWLQEGDANTKLFHLHSCHQKRKNFIARLVADDNLYKKHEEKAQLVDLFYENLLGTSSAREQTINLNGIGCSTHNLSDLDRPLTVDKVWLTIKNMPSDKAPGSDGLTRQFYKSCWQIIKQDIMEAMSAVWSRKMMGLTALNTAYITLLPK
jgi:hypothetical protein